MLWSLIHFDTTFVSKEKLQFQNWPNPLKFHCRYIEDVLVTRQEISRWKMKVWQKPCWLETLDLITKLDQEICSKREKWDDYIYGEKICWNILKAPKKRMNIWKWDGYICWKKYILKFISTKNRMVLNSHVVLCLFADADR